MPNYCENILKVEGPAKEIARFKKAARGRGPNPDPTDVERPLSLHALVPQPEEFKAEGTDWYGWRITNWGTKWDIEPLLEKVGKTWLEYHFESAWSPPMAWLDRVGPKFPKLSFRLWYAEGGCDFAGIYTVENESAVNEEKDFVTAQIEERGSYNVQCGYCDADIDITNKNDVRICEECLTHRCANCDHSDKAHIDEKCPFDATTFKHIDTEKNR